LHRLDVGDFTNIGGYTGATRVCLHHGGSAERGADKHDSLHSPFISRTHLVRGLIRTKPMNDLGADGAPQA
jgi:hypothetical protein